MEASERQLPVGDEIFLDHVGHFVPDPEAAGAALARAGFAPTPRSVQVNAEGHPTGTGNITAMLRRGYIEVLFKTADTPLGREFDASLARHAGIHLAAFAVAHASTAHGRLDAAGFRTRPLVHMQRPVGTATGTATAAFTVARVEAGEMAEGRIQILTHHSEDAVWQPRWLAHPNGAHGLTSLIVAVEDVKEAVDRFERFTGRAATQAQGRQVLRLDRGRIELVPEEMFRAAVPEISPPSLPFMGAYGVAVESLETLTSFLRYSGIETRCAGDCLVTPFPRELGTGAWIFSQRGESSLFG